MMGQSPAFQFYAAEYLADINVQLLTLEQEGAYIRLLAFCWREGSVPNNDAMLSMLCKGCESSTLAAVKALFEVSKDGTNLIHKRLESERKKQKSWKKKCSAGGKNSASRRKAKKEEELGANKKSRVVELPNELNGNSSSSSSSSSSNKSADVSVAARVLSERIGNLDIRFQEQLARMLPTVCKPDEGLEECVERMVGQWERYNAARGDLNYPVGSSRKFLESGTWHDEKLWPWKDGKQPAGTRKREYVNA